MIQSKGVPAAQKSRSYNEPSRKLTMKRTKTQRKLIRNKAKRSKNADKIDQGIAKIFAFIASATQKPEQSLV